MKANPVYALILAGGASARFWPLKGDEHPKYLLKPDGETTLIGGAFQRCLSITSADRIMVVTGAAQAERVRAALPQLLPENLLVEPCRRDTLAAVAWGTLVASQRNPEAIVVVTPADVLVTPVDAFASPFSQALEAGFLNETRLCSFGVTPIRPETGFGYVQAGEHVAPQVRTAVRFVEKPSLVRAQEYVDSGDFLWNSGSFAWRASACLAECERQHPGMEQALSAFAALPENDMGREDAFRRVPATSVDYGVMEHCRELGLLVLEAGFDDVGTWDALARHGGLRGIAGNVEGSNNLVYGTDRVGFVGVSDLIVARNGEDILVMRQGNGQVVKQVPGTFAPEEAGG